MPYILTQCLQHTALLSGFLSASSFNTKKLPPKNKVPQESSKNFVSSGALYRDPMPFSMHRYSLDTYLPEALISLCVGFSTKKLPKKYHRNQPRTQKNLSYWADHTFWNTAYYKTVTNYIWTLPPTTSTHSS